MIDGGPDEKVLSKLGRAMPFWDRSIDMVILTHPHADHLDGLYEVLKRYDIGMVVESGVAHTIPEYKEWRELLHERNIQMVRAYAGERIYLGDNAALDVFAPLKNFLEESVKNVHDANVVSRLRYEKKSILFMGDAEKSLEFLLLSRAQESSFFAVDSDMLKVGHHGSKTSSTEEFLRSVSPRVAVISAVRKNRYGHPHQEVVDRLQGLGIDILRTDEKGDIRIESDGNVITILP